MRPPFKTARRKGFSLLEMLIVCSLFGLVTSVVAVLFNKGHQIYRHGEAHIEMQRGGRHLVSRLTPFLGSMFDGSNPDITPILIPSGAGATSTELVFNTTEDWFAVGYPTAATSATLAPGISGLRKFTYRVRLINNAADENNRCVVLERINGTGSAVSANNVITAPVRDNTRVILRPKSGKTIENFQFEWPQSLSDDLIRLTFRISQTVIGEAGGRSTAIRAPEDFRITFNLPKRI